jgi:hypothetical protein
MSSRYFSVSNQSTNPILAAKDLPMTPSRIDPATFRFEAQCLNLCATACPRNRNKYHEYFLGMKSVGAEELSDDDTHVSKHAGAAE